MIEYGNLFDRASEVEEGSEEEETGKDSRRSRYSRYDVRESDFVRIADMDVIANTSSEAVRAVRANADGLPT